jgi:hypothetical protein
VRKKGVDRLAAQTSATGAPIFLSRRQCPRRLGKNPGYTTSPRSALPTDGEANTGGRTADASSRHRDPRAAACVARARRNDPQKWLTRCHLASPGPSAWAASAAGPAPPRPAAAPALQLLMGRRKILFGDKSTPKQDALLSRTSSCRQWNCWRSRWDIKCQFILVHHK